MPLNLDSVIDAEFETVLPVKRAEALLPRAAAAFPDAAKPLDGLACLRGSDAAQPKNDHPEQLTPAFLFFTAVAAFTVFWVSGGHTLLY